VWYGTTNNSDNAGKFGDDVNVTTATITGLNNDTTYYVWVKAKNAEGTSGFSPFATGVPEAALAAPAAPDAPTLSIVSRNTQFNPTNQGGTITATWTAVSGATSYKVYYAPCIGGAVPSIPGTPAQTVGTTTANITAPDIGNNTMDYYVWVKAVNTGGDSPASPAASTFARFIGDWNEPGFGDTIYLTNADAYYGMMPAYAVYGYIRAVIPFGEDVDFQGKDGAAGVIIVEEDDAFMSGSGWMHVNGKHFIGLYYYGLTGYLAGCRACLAWSWNNSLGVGGHEKATLDEAIASFTLDNCDLYVYPGVAVFYEWNAP
jgi:hypothetical protein